MIRNPILPGFNPDPSICRAGDDYYIATSTFEWYPGVQIHHSRNLVDWALVARPLSRASQLDMRGNPDSCGIWAPCLSYADGLFWLVYTDVKRYDGNFKDAHNYIVTATAIEGEWSDPVYVNSSGFDPSLFHDTDGRKWFLNLVWNHRATALGQSPLHSPFGGIALQEYSHQQQCLLGDSKIIFSGSSRGLAEGAHLFRRGDYYYLVTAEGGTGYEHAVTHARSTSLAGPYELHPDLHVMTANYADNGLLQRTGHGQTVETPGGEWYHTHLCSRPLPGMRRSPLGRETAIQQCSWGSDNWLRLSHGGQQPALETPAPKVASGEATDVQGMASSQSTTSGDYADVQDTVLSPDRTSGDVTDVRVAAPGPNNTSTRYSFETAELPMDFQWLRTPESHRLFSLQERPGFLRLYGRESIGSFFEQSLVARRLAHHAAVISTQLTFNPQTFQQSAGLVAYYNRHKFHYLQITNDEQLGPVLSIMSCNGDWPDSALSFHSSNEPLTRRSEEGSVTVELRCNIRFETLQFQWRQEGDWQAIGSELDASVLSDEGGRGEHASFTGCFVGMMAFDITGAALPADFSYFDYQC